MKYDNRYGFVRSAVASPKLRVGDTVYNAMITADVIRKQADNGVDLLVFPELGLTGYSCKDMFHQLVLQEGAVEALEVVRNATAGLDILVTVGLPLKVEGQLFNCAAVLHRGKILGIVPKSYPPNYKNFEELRWFAPADTATAESVKLFGQEVPFGTNLLFPCKDMPDLVYAVEICEDGWIPVPPGAFYALFGATVIGNPSASNDTVSKASYREQLFSNTSARYMAAYLYASSGVHESSNDMVFGGHVFLCENGTLLSKNERFERDTVVVVNDVDIERLACDRTFTNSFGENRRVLQKMLRPEYTKFRRIEFSLKRIERLRKLLRFVDANPFVPKGRDLAERCEEISQIQMSALAQRIESVSAAAHTLYGYDGAGYEPTKEQLATFKGVIGISGGLDSTLALLQACRAFDMLGISRKNILGFTMPGFGTDDRTRNNALKLMTEMGISQRTVDIRAECVQSMLTEDVRPYGVNVHALRDKVSAENLGAGLEALMDKLVAAVQYELSHIPPAVRKKGDLRFENLQARIRTQILMQNGFVIGTGDLSELIKGWCTYNGDHMSMYNVNAGVPKTLVKWVVAWLAHHKFDNEARETLLDIVGTPITPGLEPVDASGQVMQKTEDSVGPYELTDFMYYYMLRFGFSPEKILYLMEHATFDQPYTQDEHRHWMCDLIERFFRAQFKRSAVPNSPKVGTLSVSPRGDLRWPSDACAALWLSWLDSEERNKRLLTLTRKPVTPVPAANTSATISQGVTMSTTSDTKIGDATAAVLNDSQGSGAIEKIASPVRALVCVDALNDFGSAKHSDGNGNTAQLPVEGGEEVGPVIGEIQAKSKFDRQVACTDKHHRRMFNLASNNPGKKPYIDMVPDCDNEMAVVYPDHCLLGTWGAEHLPGVNVDQFERIFPKGTELDKDSYSGAGNREFIPWLKQKGVTHVYVVGLVKRICVGMTAIDLAKAGFNVYVIEEATRDLPIEAMAWVLDKCAELGVKFVSKDEVIAGTK
jgi:NAD+ synthase (glutamine-hydrolysing)